MEDNQVRMEIYLYTSHLNIAFSNSETMHYNTWMMMRVKHGIYFSGKAIYM